jgi:hypothetical protein
MDVLTPALLEKVAGAGIQGFVESVLESLGIGRGRVTTNVTGNNVNINITVNIVAPAAITPKPAGAPSTRFCPNCNVSMPNDGVGMFCSYNCGQESQRRFRNSFRPFRPANFPEQLGRADATRTSFDLSPVRRTHLSEAPYIILVGPPDGISADLQPGTGGGPNRIPYKPCVCRQCSRKFFALDPISHCSDGCRTAELQSILRPY